MIFEILKQKQAMKIEYKNNYNQSDNEGEKYIISIPKSNNHDTNFISTINLISRNAVTFS